ncbi:MAG: cell wall hydrolase [Coprococcus sp.]
MKNKNSDYVNRFIYILVILLLVIIAVGAKIYIVDREDSYSVKTVSNEPVQTDKDSKVKDIAQEAIRARMMTEGVSTIEEDISNVIEVESEKKYLLARLVYAEAGSESDEHQQAVASVVLNRMNSDKFPDSIDEVIYQRNPLQYACIEDGNIDKIPDERAIKNAYYIWDNGSILPDNVLYQAEFKQGSGVYKQIGNTYFCYE